MRFLAALALLALAPALPLAAQTACDRSALDVAAKTVADVRQRLQKQAVTPNDPKVSPAIAQQLGELKAALTQAAQAAFHCASAAATPEQLQTLLTDALHANLALSETQTETDDQQDRGTYGTDLAVQIFELASTPKLFEVDFRYGIECGDDHLLLVFQTAGDHAPEGWHEQLRWSAPHYATIGDALGDFVLLAPLTGSYKHPSWHFVVAHGHPGCGATPRLSRFDLDLLTPTADPARPAVDWHFEHAYTQGNTAPRLATTEDTITFRIAPSPSPGGQPTTPSTSPEVYRFQLNAHGQVEPAPPVLTPTK